MDQLEKLKKVTQKAINEACKETAQEVTFLIESWYESIIEAFYADYTPHSYRRTESTFYGSDAYPFDSYRDPEFDGTGYIGGITVSDANIPGHPYKADTEWVFSRTFQKGIHGYTSREWYKWFKRKSINSNWKKMLNIKSKQMLEAVPDKKARRQLEKDFLGTLKQFSYISSLYNKEGMKVMNPSPEKQLNKQFNKLHFKNNKTIDNIFNSILQKKLSK